jgi:hypothetical protein
MMLRVRKYAALAACLLSLVPREAKAWSRDGHRIVCRIAWQLLDQARRNEVERLTSTYRNPDGQPVGPFWDACSYPDDARARSAATGMASFAIFERGTTPTCRAPTVQPSARRRASSQPFTLTPIHCATPAAIIKGQALFFLSHWVGDLHQLLRGLRMIAGQSGQSRQSRILQRNEHARALGRRTALR